jgi:hypothetical protein
MLQSKEREIEGKKNWPASWREHLPGVYRQITSIPDKLTPIKINSNNSKVPRL